MHCYRSARDSITGCGVLPPSGYQDAQFGDAQKALLSVRNYKRRCRLDAVVLVMITRREFGPETRSVPTARHFLIGLLRDIPSDICERATLMISELATNAVQHSRTGFVVQVELTVETLTIDVTDTGIGQPRLRFATPQDPSGRGLQIVKALSDEWGIRVPQIGPGKTVWFALSLPTAQLAH
jgi:signal transduction histidine kinase